MPWIHDLAGKMPIASFPGGFQLLRSVAKSGAIGITIKSHLEINALFLVGSSAKKLQASHMYTCMPANESGVLSRVRGRAL